MHGEALDLFSWRNDRQDRPMRAVAPLPLQLGDPDGLRPYQREADTRALEQLGVVRSTLLVMATGLGKTQTFGAIAKHWPGRVLVLAHRSELLDQARRRLQQMTGEPVGLEQADFWAAGERLVVGSVQTLSRAQRLARFEARPFGLVIVDEAHHTSAKSYRRILEAFPTAKVLGVTATPDRGDGQALGEIYETVAYVRDIEAGIDDGYLVPVSVRQVVLERVDLSKVHTVAGDLNLGELDEQMQKENETVAAKCIELCEGRKTIVFSTKVATAHDLVATFNKVAGRLVAAAVDGETPWDQRRSVLAGHARGDFQFLVNVGIATEGYDCPEVSAVAIARPTKSRALYTQMAGRGLRVLSGLVEGVEGADQRLSKIAASCKADCLLLDFAGNAGRHALVSPLDILGGRLAEIPADIRSEVKQRAEELARKGLVGADEALKRARAEIEAERRKRAEDIRKLEARVQASVYEVDPFGASGRQDGISGKQGPTPAMRERLIQFGYSAREIGRMSMGEAGRAIGEEKARRAAGLGTHKQVQCLRRYGLAGADRLTRSQSSALISAFERNSWRPLPAATVDAIVRSAREPGMEG